MSIWYRQGTVNIANGATAVTGILTTWNNQVKPGDRFSADGGGKWYEVEAVGSNTSLTLATPFQEATVTGGAYAIDRSSVLWTDAGDIAIKIAALLETQTDVYSGTGAPSPTLGAEGSVYIEFVAGVPSKIYVKGSGGWDAGTSIPGPPGPAGPGYAATSTTSLVIGTGSKVFTTQAGRGYVAGTRARAASAANPSVDWMEGVVASYVGTALTITVDLVGGSGSHADWNLSLAGEQGQPGLTIPDIDGLSPISGLSGDDAFPIHDTSEDGTFRVTVDQLADMVGGGSSPSPRARFVNDEGLHAEPQSKGFARIKLPNVVSVPNATLSSALPFDVVEHDTMGAYRGEAGRLYVPPNADFVAVSATVAYPSNSTGRDRMVQVLMNGTFLDQAVIPPNNVVSRARVRREVQVNQPGGPPVTYFEAKAYQDSGGALDANAESSLSLEVLQRKPFFANRSSMKTIQGFVWEGVPRNWAHILTNQFAGNYTAMVTRLASFGILNLGSVVGWGPGTSFPHPKSFAGTYTPTSPAFNLAGRNASQFLRDIKSINPEVRVFIYTTPLLDYTADPWDDETGVPTAGTAWSPEAGGPRWANFKNTIDACFDDGGRNIDGLYFDLVGAGNIDFGKLSEAVFIAKRSGLSVMCNTHGASLANARFQSSIPYLGAGDFIYVEGFHFDSTNGDTSVASATVAAEVAKHGGRGLRLAAVIEELGGTTDAGMATGTPLTHWNGGLGQFGTYAQAGWCLEHNRAPYDYVGYPGQA